MGYKSRKDPQHALRIRLRDLAASRVRYGYRRLHVLLRREGWRINLKRVRRLYNLEGLSLRRLVLTPEESQEAGQCVAGYATPSTAAQ